MKYSVDNNLDLFEFHDAEFSFVSFDKNELVLSANHLNIHKNIPQNPHDCDMEIDLTELHFGVFDVISFEPMRKYKVDDDGNWYTDEPQIIYDGKEAKDRFVNETKNGITINCIEIYKKENKFYIELSTCAKACFFATVTFDNVFVEWNEYCNKAWYELHKQYIRKGYLITPTGEEETEIHIVHHLEDMYYHGKFENGPTVNVGVKYNDEQLWGQGKDYLWADAFADAQKQLPDGVLLKCCMTCRHGNMCPYGNEPGKLFCTKDLIVNSKDDMCNIFDNSETNGIYEREKFVADNCDEYIPQSSDYYTYNDYLLYFDK